MTADDTQLRRFDVGLEVRRVRKDVAQRSQAEIAHSAGIGERTLQRIESGQRQPSGGEVIRLAKALDVPVRVLFKDSIAVSKYSNLAFAGSLYTADMIDVNTVTPFVVFHVHEYEDWRVFESDPDIRRLWSDFYGIDPNAQIKVRPAVEIEREVWGGGAAEFVKDMDARDKPAFLVNYPQFEVGLLGPQIDE
jgi:transcriptional regulator with XRE-family HTH domain